ncbi:hypothetical protein, partial [Nocardia gamkensis]|uniref:hypothetical protein n=1 Tax=Nocardia gamkensis TaxID=352869 RepID=UPI001C3FCB91
SRRALGRQAAAANLGPAPEAGHVVDVVPPFASDQRAEPDSGACDWARHRRAHPPTVRELP